MQVWELIARESVRHTIARYAHAADRGRFDELVALFTDQGVMAIDDREPLVGRAAIRQFVTQTKGNLQTNLERPYIRHHVNSIAIDVQSEDTATAACYFLAITERGPDHWGRYLDRLERHGELWLFAERKVRVDGHSPTSWRATRSE